MFSSMEFFGNIDSLERVQRRFVRLNGYKRQKNDEAINDPSPRTPLTTTHMPPIILNTLLSDVGLYIFSCMFYVQTCKFQCYCNH